MTTDQKLDIAGFVFLLYVLAGDFLRLADLPSSSDKARGARFRLIGGSLLTLVYFFGAVKPGAFVVFGTDLSIPMLLGGLLIGALLMRNGSRSDPWR